MRKFIITFLSAFLLSCTADNSADQNKPSSPSDLLKPEALPAWAYPQACEPDPHRHWLVYGSARTGTEEMKPAIARLRYLVKKPDVAGNLLPYYMLTLARMLTDMDLDRAAYRQLDRLRRLPADTPYTSKLKSIPDLGAVKRKAAFIQARILARNGFVNDAAALLEGLKPATIREKLQAAEALLMAGSPAAGGMLASATAISDSLPRPEQLHPAVIRQAVLARTAGLDSLLQSLIRPYISGNVHNIPEYMDASITGIMKALGDVVVTGPADRTYRDGTYTGSCRGFVGQVDVAVDIFRNRLTGITVTATKENRPWSALTVIPERILKRQSLTVDAVSGATITSCAVIIAVDRALADAAR